MTESQKLQNELNEFNAKRLADKKALTVECSAPKLSRNYSYRKSVVITASDACSL